MPIYLVSSSERIFYDDFVEAPTEELARIAVASKFNHKKSRPVDFRWFAVDSVMTWEEDLPDYVLDEMIRW